MSILKSLLGWMFGSSPRPSSNDLLSLPTIEFDESSFRLKHVGDHDYETSWVGLTEVWVLILAGEAWWSLRSREVEVAVPTSVVAGGDAFTRRVRSLPGFDDEAFLAAMRVEQKAEEGEWDDDDPEEFFCWRNPEAAEAPKIEELPAVCDVCAELKPTRPIFTEEDLEKALLLAKGHVERGTLRHIDQEPLGDTTFEVRGTSRAWPDYIQHRFACTECGASFLLTAESHPETMHGWGGEWGLADTD